MNSFVPSSGSTSRNRSPQAIGLAFRRRFFRDDRHLRDGAGEVLADDGLRALVGERDRTAVVLGANAAVLRVDLHHRGPRGERGLGEEKGDLVRRCGTKIEPRGGVQRNSPSKKAVFARSTKARFMAEVVAASGRIGYMPNTPAPVAAGIDHRIGRLTTVSLAPLDLAALLCSRVCHDVISPVGAIVNGLEVLDGEEDADMRAVAMDLIKKSAVSASARLQFCRLAFGAAGSLGASIDTGDAENVARGLIGSDRTTLRWNAERRLAPKNAVKLLLNLCLIAAAAVPRGGVIEVDLEGEGDAMTMRVEARGANARIAHNAAALLSGGADRNNRRPFHPALLHDRACARTRHDAQGFDRARTGDADGDARARARRGGGAGGGRRHGFCVRV